MKSPMSQIFMITLAIVFAMALSLTIALICISYIRADKPEPFQTDTQESESHTSTLPVYNPLETLPPAITDDSESTTTTLLEPEDDPIDLGNGLSYASNGDGTCTLIGIGSCTDVCIVIPDRSPAGDRVISIAPRAFYGCTYVTAIQIPSTVISIGDLAFAACNNLVYISVNEANAYYCDVDGILYSADGRSILLYPPMRAGNTATISAATTEIMDMAFYNCAYLTHIHYTGTAEQWEHISIGSKNYSLTAAAKTFGNGGKK